MIGKLEGLISNILSCLGQIKIAAKASLQIVPGCVFLADPLDWQIQNIFFADNVLQSVCQLQLHGISIPRSKIDWVLVVNSKIANREMIAELTLPKHYPYLIGEIWLAAMPESDISYYGGTFCYSWLQRTKSLLSPFIQIPSSLHLLRRFLSKHRT